MIIGFDAKRAFQNNTGLGNYSRMLICGLVQRHKDVRAVLYAPRMSGEYRSYFSSYANISTRQPSGFDRHFPSLWRGFGVAFHLAEDKVDVYHGLSHELPHGISHDIKKIVTMHDLIVWRYPRFYRPFDRWMHRLKQRHSCKIADVVVAISEQTKRDLIDYMQVPEEKIRVLYQSCDSIFWQPVEQYDVQRVRKEYDLPERYFISVGTIEERKNQATIVRAMQQLPGDVHLVLVGRDTSHYAETVYDTIAQTGLKNRVDIISDADFSDFPALYAGAVGSVYVSLFEGFGIPILESMCCDTPVITSNRSSMPEAGGDAALYADPENVDEIARQMLRLLNDAGLRDELVKKSREQKQKFAPDVINDQFYQLYNDVLNA